MVYVYVGPAVVDQWIDQVDREVTQLGTGVGTLVDAVVVAEYLGTARRRRGTRCSSGGGGAVRGVGNVVHGTSSHRLRRFTGLVRTYQAQVAAATRLRGLRRRIRIIVRNGLG
jgi:hypothetical protein